ncbi:MAG: TonB-dependent receptor [Ignavibacteriaceae bacterium]
MKYQDILKTFFILIFFPTFVFCSGNLMGNINDSLNNSALVGANVYLEGTSLGSAADIDGNYRINDIPAGNYQLKVSYIGYQTKTLSINIINNRSLVIDVKLSPVVLEGKEIIVRGQALGQAKAINQQLTSNTIINVVSEEKIQELPDANAAEAIGRLPGVSVTRSGGEATKIVLRGLSDKYTNVTIDGIRIPSTDAMDRGIDLSAISQSSLAGIELYKALTADKDADAIAGTVNLVTKKAPSQRQIRGTFYGGYNSIMKSAKQYNFSLKYGERFFDDLLGVQLDGNIENKIRSNEYNDINYDQSILNQTNYFINDFTLRFTDEIRKRNGLSLILDYNTPEQGNIKFNGTYYSTNRSYITHQRDYPNGGGQTQYLGGVTYSYRDREQDIKTATAAITGDNILFNLNLNWGLSFAQSTSQFPYDYQLDFSEPSDNVVGSGMRSAPQIKNDPEQLVQYAYNNFRAATLAGAYFSSQDNLDKNKTVFLNLSRDYTFGNLFAGELKIGAKYNSKSRNNNQSQNFAPYYLGYWQPYEKLPDGTLRPKDLSGTFFDAFYQRYQQNPLNNTASMTEFLDGDPKSRLLYGKYDLNPLINRDKLRQWYDLNKFGVNQSGQIKEYYNDPTFSAYFYDITEAVTAGYIMNTLKIGQDITFIAGVRVESEDNNYKNKFSNTIAGGFPSITIPTRDTSAAYTESIVLPNFHLNIKVTDFMNVRLAAYRALARPDFNMRLNTYFGWRPAAVGSNKQLIVGNSKLKTAKAWNFEINTSFYGNEIGLFTISAFYKEIADMYHMLNQINTTGDVIFQKLGLNTHSLQVGSYQLTIPYNSPENSKVWGFELEHQINFIFLPGLLKNIVLSYNASIIRSETHLIGSTTDTTYKIIEGFPPLPQYTERAIDYKQQLENQPEFFGNISLGYDIGGFSGRISLFHQSDYFSSFSPTGRGDVKIAGYNRVDLALKQNITDYLTILLNINNLTNLKDDNLIDNRVNQYIIPNTSQRYGLTGEFGIRVDL